MNEDFSAPKGTRDFLPEEKMQRNWIMEEMKGVFELYGYSPLETPALEKWETLSSKYAGGEEILKETYSLSDQGGRRLGLKYDLTVPFSRVVANNLRNLQMPFKCYRIQPVWRDGPLKLGRYREFYQCDADLIGVSGVEADAEVMAFSCDLFASLGLEIVLKFNDRKLLNAVMEAAGIRETEKRLSAILSLDKLEKIGWEGVEKEMIERGVEKSCVVKLKELFGKLPKASAERVLVVKKFVGGSELGKEGIGEVERLLELSDYYGISGIIEFSPTLARGLSYYTGPMYECVLKDSKITSSVAGGGRYDELVGLFAGTRDRIPATGISFGMETIFDALKLEGKLKGGKTAAQAIVIPVKIEKECIQVARELRKFGVKALLDLNSRSLQRNLEYASKTGITYAVIVGEKELKLGKVKLRDLKTEREEELGIREAAREITGKS